MQYIHFLVGLDQVVRLSLLRCTTHLLGLVGAGETDDRK